MHRQARSYDDIGPPSPPGRPMAPKPPGHSPTKGAPSPPVPRPWQGGNAASHSALLALVPGRTVGVGSHHSPQRRRMVVAPILEPLPKLKDDGSNPSSTPSKRYSKPKQSIGRSPSNFSRPPRSLDAAVDLRQLCQRMEVPGNPLDTPSKMNHYLMKEMATDLDHLSSKAKGLTQSKSSPSMLLGRKPKGERKLSREHSLSPTREGKPAQAAVSDDGSHVPRQEKHRNSSPKDMAPQGSGTRRNSGAKRGSTARGARRKTDATWVNARHAELAGVFRRLQQDGEVHVDCLKRALELLAFVSPDDSWIKEVLEYMTQYRTLDFEEFVDFVVDYKAREELAGAEFFAQVDDDHSGLINLNELATLLGYCGMFPMIHVLENIAMEVTALKDVSGDEIFTYDDFRRIFEVLKGREGFTLEDAEKYKDVFQMFDHDHSGDMDTRELMSALGYLGFALPREVVIEVAQEVDVDDSGSMNEMEFLKCIRKVHERETACMRQMFDSFDVDGSQGISGLELHQMLRSLGYYPTNRAIRDAAEDAGITNLREELCFESLWRLCEVYRCRDGLTRAEAQEIEDIFNLVDSKKTGELRTCEVARMFRVLGYPITFEVAQRLTAEVDINGSGRIDLAEFKKIVRKYRERDTRNATVLYKDLGATPEAARDVLKSLGLDKAAKANLEFGDIAQLAMFVRKAREKARSSVRAQSGFTSEQSLDLLRKFKEHDSDGSGDIAYKELRDLLMDLFPHVAANAEKRPQLLEIVAAADEDRSGTLDFGDFVRLVRQWRDVEEKDRFKKEETAVKTTGFSASEVRDFRELFMGDVKERTRLSLEALEELLSSTIPLGHRNLKDLKVMYIESAKPKPHEAINQLDFPEFLYLMRRLIDMNFAGMADFR
eukprot:CAMPEP_0178390020 /NCGR_PEP_ID=MMETSP0689_2-20121128/10428_1 /TAXON_ID=160604 /ORGANISM="Amphidinium massartii, Strain CS-259" /LENGTH=885 /DNA_ID=CAMNT_0020010511 /DNA_START=6 /DNA_END=2663 /DNA_ORIENTATION=+